jgi:hypothetical protein
MKYLDVISKTRTGLQSGVDQAAANHAMRHRVSLCGFIPAGNRAEVYRDGEWRDEDDGIPKHLLDGGDFVPTSVQNVTAALASLDEQTSFNCQHLIEMAARNPSDPNIRTELNIVFSAFSLIILTESPKLNDGSIAMSKMADRHERPHYTLFLRRDGSVDEGELECARERILRAVPVSQEYPGVVNLGGPRTSHQRDWGMPIEPATTALLDHLFGTH